MPYVSMAVSAPQTPSTANAQTLVDVSHLAPSCLRPMLVGTHAFELLQLQHQGQQLLIHQPIKNAQQERCRRRPECSHAGTLADSP